MATSLQNTTRQPYRILERDNPRLSRNEPRRVKVIVFHADFTEDDRKKAVAEAYGDNVPSYRLYYYKVPTGFVISAYGRVFI